MPSLIALAIMPLCRISARNTWHRRHNVRRLLAAFVPRFPETMWSIWQDSRGTAAPQRTQHPLSRSHTRRRISTQISLGGRFLGIAHLKRLDRESPKPDVATIA